MSRQIKFKRAQAIYSATRKGYAGVRLEEVENADCRMDGYAPEQSVHSVIRVLKLNAKGSTGVRHEEVEGLEYEVAK